MTLQELMDSTEMEEYCLLHDYTITWNRWEASLVFSRDNEEYRLKDGVDPGDVLEAIRDLSADDPLMAWLEVAEYPPEDVLQ